MLGMDSITVALCFSILFMVCVVLLTGPLLSKYSGLDFLYLKLYVIVKSWNFLDTYCDPLSSAISFGIKKSWDFRIHFWQNFCAVESLELMYFKVLNFFLFEHRNRLVAIFVQGFLVTLFHCLFIFFLFFYQIIKYNINIIVISYTIW